VFLTEDGQPRRFTPTRVGTSTSMRRRAGSRSVHPHTRGDINFSQLTRNCNSGSPPHAWGHRARALSRLGPWRFTPTRVGTSSIFSQRSSSASVHPHTRGDITSSSSRKSCAFGSPPHAWGHPEIAARSSVHRWFTPTRVGTSIVRRGSRPPSPVHPHTRGDIVSTMAIRMGDTGSPPHAWGHQLVADAVQIIERFTPTRVGTSQTGIGRFVGGPVHPHTRGDITMHGQAQYLEAGSPPHAWGHHFSAVDRVVGSRFTPTRVGTS